ncbi:MAG: biotin/lipoyl-containing protein, partial [Candidatus Dormibacteraceae bacterium]
MGVAPIKMPQLGESVTEGTVDHWLKKEGDFVKRDEALVEVVTDKVNAEIPSPFEGTLVRISVAEGETVAVGIELAQIETDGAPAAPVAAADNPAADSTSEPVQAPLNGTPAAPPNLAPPAPVGEGTAGAGADRPRFSPAVRRLVEQHGIDPIALTGTGEGGRVTRDDVLALIERAEAPPAPAAKAPAPT